MIPADLEPSHPITTSELDAQLGPGAPAAPHWRATLDAARETVYDAFRSGAPVQELVATYTALIDHALIRAWRHFFGDLDGAALLAVGGYGRGELMPYSDVDLLILHEPEALETLAPAIEQFVTFAWDMGLDIGHSVRSPDVCIDEASGDITIVTNLMESRLLEGDAALAGAMMSGIAPDKIWPAPEFFRAKAEEQRERYQRYDDSAYKLEPNVKEGPGGLRDIHLIGWMTLRLYGVGRLNELRSQGLLSQNELNDLYAFQYLLWGVRFALHMLTGRREDRLLFDHQIRIAEVFGYVDKSHRLGVEQFMQVYYRAIKGLSCLNDILLQQMEEQIFFPQGAELPVPTPLDERFLLRNGFIEAAMPNVFVDRPLALLEIFKLWAENAHLGIKGISATTLREMRRDRELVNSDAFRATLEARRTFMDILRLKRGVLHTLRRMHRYGILGRYIPAFGQVTGRMQYDLFHTLTVDEHTLFVVRNIRRLSVPEFRHEFPQLSTLFQRLRRPELLYLAGLFHDIAKGRGGDHSELGADDALTFGQTHGLSSADAELVAWLVRNHLLMSVTAQRKDVSDPDVVNEFAANVGRIERLDHLYLLTVCDIRATNPKLWNGFRDSLLSTLYGSARLVLERGDPMGEAELIGNTRNSAALKLAESGLPESRIEAIWSRFDGDYFLRHSADEVAWQTQAIANATTLPCVLVRQFTGHGTAVFVYTPDTRKLFATMVAGLAQAGLNILDARISSTTDGYTIDTFVVSEPDGSDITDPARRDEIRQRLDHALLHLGDLNELSVSQRVSGRRKHFTTPTQIYFSPDNDGRHSVMELVANDRPGLLLAVGQVLAEMNIEIIGAKIGTLGERAEDIFFITDAKGRPLEDPALFHELRERLTAVLRTDN